MKRKEKIMDKETMLVILRDNKIATYEGGEYTDFTMGEDFFTIYNGRQVVAMYAKDYVLAVEFDK